MNVKGGYFLREDIRCFENAFFGINAKEATHMDPQQRKLLEVSFEAFENAGLTLTKLSGSNTGCYVGNFTTDMHSTSMKDMYSFHQYTPLGVGATLLSNRLSYVFDLRGPSLTLDTACSSTMYCLHFAAKALQRRECDGALVAGANLIQAPEQMMGTARLGVLSSTSTCHTFSADADGYGRADGIGALFLKRLSDAIRDGDPVRSIIRGTAINSNGKGRGITLPSIHGQIDVIRQAYADAAMDPGQTDYVECHGTGTSVGDPIEVAAISDIFRSSATESTTPLPIGSVKTNFGHSEAASAITSLIKCTLAMEKSVIPATVGIEQLNEKIPWANNHVQVIRSAMAWPRNRNNNYVPRASINSFGYGGANAHCILERGRTELNPDDTSTIRSNIDPQRPYLLPFSAKTGFSLQCRARDLAEIDLDGIHVADLAFTLAVRRTSFNHRAFLIKNQTELVGMRNELRLLGPLTNGVLCEDVPVAFVFTGQGAQWPQMGMALYDRCAAFRDSFSHLDRILYELPNPPSWTLKDTLFASPESSKMHLASRSQPMCTAVQVGLVDLLRSWGIQPKYVIGHSSGEIAAAYAAASISAEHAIVLAYYRGDAVSQCILKGAMMAVDLSQEAMYHVVREKGLADKAVIACINSPTNVTVSGDEDAVDDLRQVLQARGTSVRKLKTDGRAYHSHHMKVVGTQYESNISAWERSHSAAFDHHRSTRATMISTVLDRVVSRDDLTKASYWRANLESPVLFSGAIERLALLGSCQMVEIGPHPALELPVKQTLMHFALNNKQLPYLSALIRGQNSLDTVLKLAGNLWVVGHSIDLNLINGAATNSNQEDARLIRQPRVVPNIPKYRWDYSQVHWSESRFDKEYRWRKWPRDELLGLRMPAVSGNTAVWRNILSLQEVSWLKDHQIGADIVYPAAAYIGMAIRAIQQIDAVDPINYVLQLREIRFSKLLVLQDGEPTEMITELSRKRLSASEYSKSWWQWSILTHQNGQSTQHAGGIIGYVPKTQDKPVREHIIPEDNLSRLEDQAIRNWYKQFATIGLNFGPSFRSLAAAFVPRMRDAAISEANMVKLPDVLDPFMGKYPFDVHPITLDAHLQSTMISSARGQFEDMQAMVPTTVREIEICSSFEHQRIAEYKIRASSKFVAFGLLQGNAETLDGDQALIRMHDVRATDFPAVTADTSKRHPMLHVEWIPDMTRISPESKAAFTSFIKGTLPAITDTTDFVTIQVAEILKIASYGQPKGRILEVSSSPDPDISEIFLAALASNSKFKRFDGYSRGFFDADGNLVLKVLDDAILQNSGDSDASVNDNFDIVLCHRIQESYLLNALNLLKPDGLFLWAGRDVVTQLRSFDFQSVSVPVADSSEVTLAARQRTTSDQLGSDGNQNYYLVTGRATNLLNQDLQDRLMLRNGVQPMSMTLEEVAECGIIKGSKVIVTAELEKPILAIASEAQLVAVQTIVKQASDVLWVTGGQLLKSPSADFSLIFGLSRSILMEQPGLAFRVVDLDDFTKCRYKTVENLMTILTSVTHLEMDREFLQSDGILYVSRFVPDEDANLRFQQSKQKSILSMPLQNLPNCRLELLEPFQLESLCFEVTDTQSMTPDNYIEIQIKSFGLNAKDLYTLLAKVDTRERTCNLEFAGIITRVGRLVSGYTPGDRVCVAAPNHFETVQRIPEWACCKMNENESYTTLSSIPIALMTAIHGLVDKAGLRRGESVLIHSAAGGVGIAAVRLAQKIGAIIYATVGSDEKKDFLVSQLGLRRDHIFSSRGTMFCQQVRDATGGRGVDVVLNSLTGEQMEAGLMSCARFGRFIEIGKRDIMDAASLGLKDFERGLTFSVFDLSEYFYSPRYEDHMTWKDLLTRAVEHFRRLGAFEPTVFDIATVSAAFKNFANTKRVGKIAVSCMDPESLVATLPRKHNYRFNSAKSYLLVGCLGGVGRSLSRYMLANGARDFAFIGRSGTDKKSARLLVDDLRAAGASVEVIRGNVQDLSCVVAALDRIKKPLGGVVQAAMGLGEALFNEMTHKKWHQSLAPKIQGTWNLHNAIQGRDSQLDFFLCTSSLAGSVGAVTESNYCAANQFLDYFVRYRRRLGKPAVAIGYGTISEVGYLHEHPEIEKMLERRGLTPTTEADMITICDIALCSELQHNESLFSASKAHFLSGLEFTRKLSIIAQGYEGAAQVEILDPRMSILVHTHQPGNKGASHDSEASAKDFPREIVDALATKDTSVLHEALYAILAHKLSNLALLPKEKISPNIRLSAVGIDSMLAAEFRSFLFHLLKADVPVPTLMDDNITLLELVQAIAVQIDKGG
ncbi:MAG: Type I Iterative PKS [Bathelium mastoideum]|nr:MAG: Type I Iterative PKS [Bathelium mastoideum]